jgi:RHS repeat-associated protein
MANTSFHTTFSNNHFLLSRAKNGSQSGLWRSVSYRFGFNGKENDNEVKGDGNQQDYGMRIFDPRLGRFLSADPLIVQNQEYPELSPYQFASNTPIQGIDLDGLEAFIIHGSNQNDAFGTLSWGVENQLMRIGGNTKVDYSFKWHAIGRHDLLNKESDRNIYARILTLHVLKTRATMIANGEITKDEPITLIGYSHGGNVSIQASRYLGALGIKVNLITLATPTYNDIEDVENPATSSGINEHFSFVHIDDPVQGFAGGGRFYWNGKTWNFGLTDKDMEATGSLVQWEPHQELPGSDAFEKYLEGIPTMKWSSSNTSGFDGKTLAEWRIYLMRNINSTTSSENISQ